MQRLDETNREFSEKLPMFAAAGHGPYPTVEDWQHRWELQAKIDRLRFELRQITSGSSYGLGDKTLPIVAPVHIGEVQGSYTLRANRRHR
jgi:hypothetical protein